MRVLCLANDAQGLSEKHFEEGYLLSSEFDLEIGKEYIVYGISLWKGLLAYLVTGEGAYPHWYPTELFRVCRSEVPPNWYFACFDEKEGFQVNAIWGYRELINDRHFDALSNLEDLAIDIFATRRKEIDEIS